MRASIRKAKRWRRSSSHHNHPHQSVPPVEWAEERRQRLASSPRTSYNHPSRWMRTLRLPSPRRLLARPPPCLKQVSLLPRPHLKSEVPGPRLRAISSSPRLRATTRVLWPSQRHPSRYVHHVSSLSLVSGTHDPRLLKPRLHFP